MSRPETGIQEGEHASIEPIYSPVDGSARLDNVVGHSALDAFAYSHRDAHQPESRCRHASGGALWYRYRIRTPADADFRMARDFSPQNSFEWVPTETDGIYQVEVSARNRETGETVIKTLPYVIESRVTGDTPVITPTNNLLVFLYSAPPCADGSRMRVDFVAEDKFRQFTSWMRCSGTASMNVYLAGLRPETRYVVRHTIEAADGVAAQGPEIEMTTGSLGLGFPATRVLQKPDGRSRASILLQSNVFSANIATDLDGNVVWYNPASNIRYLTRAERRGYFIALIDDWSGGDTAQLLRVYDLAGNVVAETNAGPVSMNNSQ